MLPTRPTSASAPLVGVDDGTHDSADRNCTVVLRDLQRPLIRWKQANMGFTDCGLTYGNPDFVKYAEAMVPTVTAWSM